MTLEISGVTNRGDLLEEGLVLQVIENGNLSDYAIVDNAFKEKGELSHRQRHFYPFPDREVKIGEHVILYTCRGMDKIDTSDKGIVIHSFYWNLDTPVWNDKDTIYLLKVVETSTRILD